MSIKVLVTGANGQLAKTLQKLYKKNKENIEFTFVVKEELDITNPENILKYFASNDYDYCINCAAYTNVEQAEKTPEVAFLVNAEAVKLLAERCKKTNTILIHISTDYVFDGEKETPYTEHDITNPINEYGKSKLLGEQYIQESLENYFIIRTSWLYSNYGKNFLKTIIKKVGEKSQLNITTSQVGSPTSTYSLARFIFFIIKNKIDFGIYHFTDKGAVTWYDFSKMIIENYYGDMVHLISPDEETNSGTKRPKYSALSNQKRHIIYQKEIILNNAIKEITSLL